MDALIKNDIESDFYSCIGELRNVRALMNKVDELNANDNDSEDDEKIKQGQINGLLIQLGRIGELAFKYLLKLKHIELHPNFNYDQFIQGELHKSGPVTNLVNTGKISQSDYDEIRKFDSEKSLRFHNFVYLGLIVKALMPDTFSNFEKCIDYSVQSGAVLNVLKSMDPESLRYQLKYGYYRNLVIFPCLIWTGDIELDEDKMGEFISQVKSKANSSGDIFTRLRYAENNLDNKIYTVKDLKDIYTYIRILVRFINGVHLNNNNLLTKPESIHGREMALSHSKLAGRDREEIEWFFEDFFNDDPLTLDVKFFSGLDLEELEQIEEICQEYGLDSCSVLQHEIGVAELRLLLDAGCDSYMEMQDYVYDDKLRKRSLKEIEALLQKRDISEHSMKNGM